MVLIEPVEIKKDEHEGLKDSEWAKFARALENNAEGWVNNYPALAR